MFTIIDINKNYFMFERKSDLESALITANRTNNENKFYIPKEYEDSNKVYIEKINKRFINALWRNCNKKRKLNIATYIAIIYFNK